VTPADLLFEDHLPGPAEAIETMATASAAAAGAENLGLPPTLREAEKMLIMRALDQTEGNRTHAAKVLGISVRTLRNKLNEYKSEHGFSLDD
jgi:two-component system response regulator FlrC